MPNKIFIDSKHLTPTSNYSDVTQCKKYCNGDVLDCIGFNMYQTSNGNVIVKLCPRKPLLSAKIKMTKKCT